MVDVKAKMDKESYVIKSLGSILRLLIHLKMVR
jgi:hypothetical protein